MNVTPMDVPALMRECCWFDSYLLGTTKPVTLAPFFLTVFLWFRVHTNMTSQRTGPDQQRQQEITRQGTHSTTPDAALHPNLETLPDSPSFGSEDRKPCKICRLFNSLRP